jgi:outer membrane protein assembly factor BamB
VALASVPVRAGAESATGEWPQFGHTADHQGAAEGPSAFTPDNVGGLAVAWAGVFGEHASSESSVVVSGGVAYVADFDGRVSAFDLAGCGAALCDPLWYAQTDNDITATPAVADGLVLVASADRRFYAFPADGCPVSPCRPAWYAVLGAAVVDSSVAVADGVAYTGTYDGRLFAFAVDGCGEKVCEPLWVGTVGASGAPVTSSPAVGGGSVFVASNDGRLYAFPAGAAGCGHPTCNPTWRVRVGGPAFTVSPTIAGDTVFIIGAMAHQLLALPAAGCGQAVCEPRWRGDLGLGPSGATTPAVANGMVYVATQGSPSPRAVGVVTAFDVAGCGRSICQPAWTGINFASGFESSPAIAGDVVFVAKGPASGFPVDAGLYAFDARGCDAKRCSPVGFVQVGDEQFYLGSSVAVAGDQVLFASEDNADGGKDKLYVLELPAG